MNMDEFHDTVAAGLASTSAKPEPVSAWSAFAVVDAKGALREAFTSRWFAEDYVRQHGGVYRVIPVTITLDGE